MIPPGRAPGRPRRDPLDVYSEVPEIPTWDHPYRSERNYCDRVQMQHFYGCIAHGMFRARVACEQLDCWTCYDRVKKRRGRKKFLQLGGAHLAAFVFTFPSDWSQRLGYRQLRDARRRLAKLLKQWAAEVFGGEIGFYAAFHPQGDKCKRCGYSGEDSKLSQCVKCKAPLAWRPHFHIGMPLVMLADGQLEDLPFHRTPEELEALREMWGEFLGELAGKWDLEAPVSNVHYSFRTDPERIMHRMSYDCRPFSAWSAGTLPVGLASPISYGLASPGKRGEAVERWRARVRGVIEDEGKMCPVDGCAHELEHLVTIKMNSAEFDDYSGHAVLLNELGEAVPGTGPPDNPLFTPMTKPADDDRWWNS